MDLNLELIGKFLFHMRSLLIPHASHHLLISSDLPGLLTHTNSDDFAVIQNIFWAMWPA